MSKARVTKDEGEERTLKRRKTSYDEEEVTIVSDLSIKSRNISAPMKRNQYFLSCAPVGGLLSPNPLNCNQRIPTAEYGAASRNASLSANSTKGRITDPKMPCPSRSVDQCSSKSDGAKKSFIDIQNSSELQNTKDQTKSTDTCGKILKITIKDFMNHDKLDIDPGLHINIITGPNGAGKSSILQAVVLGLGKQ